LEILNACLSTSKETASRVSENLCKLGTTKEAREMLLDEAEWIIVNSLRTRLSKFWKHDSWNSWALIESFCSFGNPISPLKSLAFFTPIANSLSDCKASTPFRISGDKRASTPPNSKLSNEFNPANILKFKYSKSENVTFLRNLRVRSFSANACIGIPNPLRGSVI